MPHLYSTARAIPAVHGMNGRINGWVQAWTTLTPILMVNRAVQACTIGKVQTFHGLAQTWPAHHADGHPASGPWVASGHMSYGQQASHGHPQTAPKHLSEHTH